LKDPVERNWDHVFPASWYPKSAKQDLYKWQIPSCIPCNSEYGKLESDFLVRVALCLDPHDPASSSVVETALRSMRAAAGRDPRDTLLRAARARKVMGETLQGVRRHSYADPLADPGEVDLTAHVDFGALAHAGTASGVNVNGPLTQGEFLRRLGIAQRATRLKANATPQQAVDIDTALARLTAPDQMGELFKVMAFADAKLGALPGFDAK